VCERCCTQLNTHLTKRPNTSPNVGTPDKKRKVLYSLTARPRQRRRKKSYDSISTIISQLRRSQYERAFRLILSRGPAAERAFDKVVSQRVRQQVGRFVRQHRQPAEIFDGVQSVKEFEWGTYMARLDAWLPTLLSAARGAMPRKLLVAASHQLM